VPTLSSLLHRQTCDVGNVAVRIDNMVGVLRTAAGGLSMEHVGQEVQRPRGRDRFAPYFNTAIAQAYNEVVVPIHVFSNMRAVEKTIGEGLLLAAGGRVIDVHDWQHAPVLVGDLWKRQKHAEMVLVHPKTWHDLFVSCQTYVTPPHNAESPANFCGCEVIANADIPMDASVWIADKENLGQMFVRQVGNEMQNPYRVGLMFNAPVIAVIRKTEPPPPAPVRRSTWELLRVDLYGDWRADLAKMDEEVKLNPMLVSRSACRCIQDSQLGTIRNGCPVHLKT
jgi:hypothetical protein